MVNIGYIRVSTILQNEARQVALLENENCDKIFMDKLSGADSNRPQLQAMIEFAREGDIIICHSIDRLARSHKDLFEILGKLQDKGVNVRFCKENLDTSQGIVSQMIISILGFIAQMELANIKERQKEGIAAAKAKGTYTGGRPYVYTTIDIAKFQTAYAQAKGNLTLTAKYLGVSRSSLYKFLNENNPFLNFKEAQK